MLPELNSDGNLPEGIHPATEEEVFLRFATTSARRQWLGEQLRSLLSSRNRLGSFPACLLGKLQFDKEVPNDLDVLLVMAADFSLEALPAYCQVVFDHVQARLSFHADVFWTKASIDSQALQLWLDTYQTGKDFKRKGIVEVIVS